MKAHIPTASPDERFKHVTEFLRKMSENARKSLVSQQLPQSSRPLLQNYEAERTLKTARALIYGLGSACPVASSNLVISAGATIQAMRRLVDEFGLAKQFCTKLLEEAAIKLGVDTSSMDTDESQYSTHLRPNKPATPAVDRMWLLAMAEALSPLFRARRALGLHDRPSPSALHAFVTMVLSDGNSNLTLRRRAYWCLLVLRDGIVLGRDDDIDALIERVQAGVVFVEYFVARQELYRLGWTPILHYAAVCFKGGDPQSLELKHCLSDKQENDREIADFRGHQTGINEVEKRALGLASRMNLAVIEGARDREWDIQEYFNRIKGFRVENSLLGGLSYRSERPSKLFIRPVGDVHRVSFEALPSSYEGILGEQIEFVYLAGPALFHDDSSKSPPPDAANAVIVAGCDYDLPLSDPGASLIAPDRSSVFEPLVGAAKEGQSVQECVGGLLLAGPSAVKSRIVSALERRPSLLHFATHSFFIDRERYHARELAGEVIRTVAPKLSDSIYSGILLSGANGYINGDGEVALNANGLIEIGDILRIDLSDTLLVTLSSCESGIGAVEVGTGFDSLREAFLQAGVKCVVSSLWPVQDDHTEQFMSTFYAHLSRGMFVSEALRHTRAHLKDLPAASRSAFVAFGSDVKLEGLPWKKSEQELL